VQDVSFSKYKVNTRLPNRLLNLAAILGGNINWDAGPGRAFFSPQILKSINHLSFIRLFFVKFLALSPPWPVTAPMARPTYCRYVPGAPARQLFPRLVKSVDVQCSDSTLPCPNVTSHVYGANSTGPTLSIAGDAASPN
jgi:hypothetical protein